LITAKHRTRILLVLGILGVAGMFFGRDGWFGWDIGPIGAAVLYLVFLLFAIQLARHPEMAFGEEMSPAERRGWVGLVFVTLIAIHFAKFMLVLPTLGAQADELANHASIRFGVQLVTLLIAWAVFGGLASARADGVSLDERDVRIQHFARRGANDAVCIILFASVIVLVLYPDALRPWLRPLFVANALIGVLIANSLAEHMLLVARYRRARV
jgi:hypothetical protein